MCFVLSWFRGERDRVNHRSAGGHRGQNMILNPNRIDR